MITVLVLEILLRRFTEKKNSRFQERYVITWESSGGAQLMGCTPKLLRKNEQGWLPRVRKSSTPDAGLSAYITASEPTSNSSRRLTPSPRGDSLLRDPFSLVKVTGLTISKLLTCYHSPSKTAPSQKRLTHRTFRE